MAKYIIAPSVLSANYLDLKNELDQIKLAGAKWIHFDVMDGDFVPNLTFGPKILEDIASYCDLVIDCHLMVKIKHQSVQEYLRPFIKAGASSLTMHFEALSKEQLVEFLALRDQVKIGLALKPTTPVEDILLYLSQIDLVLVMTVEPGFGGQTFIESAAQKIKTLKNFISSNALSTLVEVDGGINAKTAEICKKYGVDVIVAGSYLFGSNDLKIRLEGLLADEL